MKVAINGMGRIGRLLFRRLIHHPEIEVVAVNDLMEPKNLVYLLKHDSIYGNTDYSITYNGTLAIDGKEIQCFSEPDPSKLPWQQLNVDNFRCKERQFGV